LKTPLEIKNDIKEIMFVMASGSHLLLYHKLFVLYFGVDEAMATYFGVK